MKIRAPHERVGKPLIGSNHMYVLARREGDETSMLVECNSTWALAVAIEGRDVMALVSECLQSMIVLVGDDDSALIIDAHSFRLVKMAWLGWSPSLPNANKNEPSINDNTCTRW